MATPAEIATHAVVALIVGIILSFGIEQLLRPRPLLGARRSPAISIHVGIWLLLFGLGVAVWQRPYFASGLNNAGLLLIVLVSNAKFASLREPFLLSDFRFFKALLRHPRLYLPFFGIVPAIACALAFLLLSGFALWLEPSMLPPLGTLPFLLFCLMAMGTGTALLLIGARVPMPITLDPAHDLQTLGLLASFVRYWQEERLNDAGVLAQSLQGRFEPWLKPVSLPQQPHIVAVQCESFFDVRRVVDGRAADVRLSPQVLENFDAFANAASQAGRLNVPAWGANTVRTEFAFLTGVAPESLGVHQFNPYRKLARCGVPTIASELKTRGYRTVCVHPFAASFYDRDVVFPALGFDEFIDINAFSESEKSGPYIGDAAVADKLATILGAANEPLFIFVITMENHGPLHQEKVAEGDHARLYANAPPAGYDEFTIYLRHLQHTDAMLGRIHAVLEGGARPGWLCAYGDHVPILPGVYDANDFSDGRTDYFIVGTGGQMAGLDRSDIAPEELAIALLRAAGVQEEKNR